MYWVVSILWSRDPLSGRCVSPTTKAARYRRYRLINTEHMARAQKRLAQKTDILPIHQHASGRIQRREEPNVLPIHPHPRQKPSQRLPCRVPLTAATDQSDEGVQLLNSKHCPLDPIAGLEETLRLLLRCSLNENG